MKCPKCGEPVKGSSVFYVIDHEIGCARVVGPKVWCDACCTGFDAQKCPVCEGHGVQDLDSIVTAKLLDMLRGAVDDYCKTRRSATTYVSAFHSGREAALTDVSRLLGIPEDMIAEATGGGRKDA